MKVNRWCCLVMMVALSLALACVLGSGSRTWAQGEERLITLDLREASLDDALRLIFKDTPYSYTLAPDISGTVSLTLNEVTFTQALRAILDMHNLTYRKEPGNIYYITRKQESTTPPSTGPAPEAPSSQQPIIWIGPGGRYELQYLDCRQVAVWFGGTIAGVSIYPVPIQGAAGGVGGGIGGGIGGGGGGGGFGGGGGGVGGGGGGFGGGGGGGGGGRGGGGGGRGGGGSGGGGGGGGGGRGGGPRGGR